MKSVKMQVTFWFKCFKILCMHTVLLQMPF